MPITFPVEVHIPSQSTLTVDFLQEKVSRFAQSLVDDALANSRPHRQMMRSEMEANSISVEESERRLTERIHRFYHPEA